jgi:hypothetical protein
MHVITTQKAFKQNSLVMVWLLLWPMIPSVANTMSHKLIKIQLLELHASLKWKIKKEVYNHD